MSTLKLFRASRDTLIIMYILYIVYYVVVSQYTKTAVLNALKYLHRLHLNIAAIKATFRKKVAKDKIPYMIIEITRRDK